MKLVLISPEHDHPQEHAVLAELFARGLERFHVRKPHASVGELRTYLAGISEVWRPRIVLHQHHELVEELTLGGRHWKDSAAQREPAFLTEPTARPEASPYLTSRSCHDLSALRAALGWYDSVFFGPVFPSISKPGYAPSIAQTGEALGAMLHTRTVGEQRTKVIAIGGIDSATAPRALALGFDGVAVLGAVWQAPDPVAAFREISVKVGRTVPGEPSRLGEDALPYQAVESAV